MDTQALSFEYDMATMALKGRRFRDAEEKFKDLASQTNSVEAWCGMALSKFGLIMEDATITEVFYCFDKARAVSTNENTADLSTVIQQSSLEAARHLYDLYINAVIATRTAQHRKAVAMVSTIAGGISTLNAASNNRTMSVIASAGFTSLSYDSYLKSHSTAAELKSLQGHIVSKIEEIKAYVYSTLEQSGDGTNEFTAQIKQKEGYVIEALKTDDQKAYEKVKGQSSQSLQHTGNWWEAATVGDENKDTGGNQIEWYNQKSKLAMSILVWPFWLYGMYMTDLYTRQTKMRWVIGVISFALVAAIFQAIAGK